MFYRLDGSPRPVLEGWLSGRKHFIANEANLMVSGVRIPHLPQNVLWVMKIIENSLIPFKGFLAINIFGVIFIRKGGVLNEVALNHEQIHTAQMKELGYVGFYILYLIEWIIRLFINKNAYKSISFEKEAYENERNLDYLSNRRHYAQWA